MKNLKKLMKNLIFDFATLLNSKTFSGNKLWVYNLVRLLKRNIFFIVMELLELLEKLQELLEQLQELLELIGMLGKERCLVVHTNL
jgi:hypothetical protein